MQGVEQIVPLLYGPPISTIFSIFVCLKSWPNLLREISYSEMATIRTLSLMAKELGHWHFGK
mgnify:CR=1 FL=1